MCGENGTLPLFPVKTLKVAAGSTIGFGAAGQSRAYSDESKDMSDVCWPAGMKKRYSDGVVRP